MHSVKKENSSTFALDNALDLKEVVTTGSILQINAVYEDLNYDDHNKIQTDKTLDFIGSPITNIKDFEQNLTPIDENKYVKKKVLEEGGGLPIPENSSVSVAFSGFWENDLKPFDCRKINKPMVVHLEDSGLLPGLDIAIRSMLVGEMSVFLLSHEVMYGELGIPPRIKPKAICVFYIKLLKCVMTQKHGEINYEEPNMFQRVLHEAKLLYGSGMTLHKSNNYIGAASLFRKAVYMLHKSRLADEHEEKIQEKLLCKLYTNLAICYLKCKLPLKACTACNELRRLDLYWNCSKTLYLNAKALRMIGQFEVAEKKLRRAMKLCPNNDDLKNEMNFLQKAKTHCNQNRLVANKVLNCNKDLLTDEFKEEVEILIKNFKENDDICKLTLPSTLNNLEIAFINEICIRENLFCNRVHKYNVDYEEENEDKIDFKCKSNDEATQLTLDKSAIDRYDEKPWDADVEAINDALAYLH